MYDYDAENHVLRIQKIREPELDVALAQYQHESYELFCKRDVYTILKAVIDKFAETIRQKVEVVYNPDVPKERQRPYNFYVAATTDPSWKLDIRAWPNQYTPVLATLNVDGAVYKNVEVFRLPHMTEEGILNIDGNRRICGLHMVTADGLSYDGMGLLNFSVPLRNIAMTIGSSTLTMKSPDKTAAQWKVLDVAVAYMVQEGINIRLDDLFTSVYARTVMTPYHAALDKYECQQLYDGEEIDHTDYATALSQHPRAYEIYHRPAYKLSKSARNSINRALSLDRAESRTLSRDVYSHDGELIATKGSVVTRDMLQKFRRGLVNVVYVKTRPNLRGYRVYSPAGYIMVHTIPAGAPIVDSIRSYLPEDLQGMTHARKTIYFDSTLPVERQDGQAAIYLRMNNIFLDLSGPLTDDVIDLLCALNIDKLVVSGGGGKWFTATFEEEILGNYMVHLGDAIGASGMHEDKYKGRAYDEWVYFYNNYELAPTPDQNDYLTAWDWLGLVGLASYIWAHPSDHSLQDRDSGMLKRIEGPNEIFCRALEAVIRETFAIQKSWINSVSNTRLVGPSFYPLYKNWLRKLTQDKALVVEHMQNPVQLMSHVRQVDVAHGLKEVADEQRMLSPGYYGRIDPYETPAGKKLGLVDTLALGARIDPETGRILTPFIKLRKDGLRGNYTRVYIDDQCEVRWLDAQEEVNYIIGDKLSLKVGPDGTIAHDMVVARVPNAQKTCNVIESVDTWQLDFVNCYCEQHLSVTSALVPFVGSDESARMTLGASMVKQSILVQYNERPRLYTSAYEHLIDNTPCYCVKAEEDGLVVMVNTKTVEYIPGIKEYKYGAKIPKVTITQLRETYHNSVRQVKIPTNVASRNTVNIVQVYVSIGQWVHKGDILYASSMASDGVYSPGCNFLTAYIPDGYTYEDAVEVSERAASQLTSISIEAQKLRLNTHYTSMPNIDIYMDNFVLENEPVATFSDPSKMAPPETHRSGLHSGIVYSVRRDTSANANSYSDYEAVILAFNKLRVGDKVIGRHSNKGTSSVIRKNSEMPRFLNGIQCDVVLNPLGVPSRLNIGQNYEAWLGFVAYLLDIYIKSNSFNGATRGEVAELMSYVYDLANSSDPKSVTAKYPSLPIALRMRGEERFDKVRMWAGCFEKDGTAWMINPASGKRYGTRITFGMPYFLKLEHEVNKKLKARAGFPDGEQYTKIHQQPVEGGARGGGERVGEMEMVALAAYGANDLIRETLNEDSDNVVERVISAAKDLDREEVLRPKRPGDIFDVEHAVPYSVEHFRYLLEVLGISMDGTFLPDCSDVAAQHRVIPDIKSITLGDTDDDIGARGADTFNKFAEL